MKRTFAIQQFLNNCTETYLIGPNNDCGECLLLPNFQQTSVFLDINFWSSLCSLPTYIIEIIKVDTPSMIYSWMENTIQSKIQYNQCHFTLIFKLIYINLSTWLSWTLILSVVNTKNMYTQISHRAKREWINYVCSTARSHMSRGCHEELT